MDQSIADSGKTRLGSPSWYNRNRQAFGFVNPGAVSTQRNSAWKMLSGDFRQPASALIRDATFWMINVIFGALLIRKRLDQHGRLIGKASGCTGET